MFGIRTRIHAARIALVVALSLVASGLTGQPVRAAPDSLGSEFWLAFPQNHEGTPTLSLFITGPVATTGTVAVPGISFSQAFSVTPGSVTTVAVPAGAQTSAFNTIQPRGIHVTAAAEVTVYGLNRIQYTTDAYLGLPLDVIGTEYIGLGYNDRFAGELTIVGTQASTSVTITPPSTAPTSVTLNVGDVYVFTRNDVTGTVVTSNKPVSVFGGGQCTNVPVGTGFCDYTIEQLPPTSAWGKQFVTEPLATRTSGDVFRMLASTDNTTITLNGTAQPVLNRGGFQEISLTTAAAISSDKPILLAQYSKGSASDGVQSDPFMMLIPPFEQFVADYTVTTPASGFSKNFINVVAPTASLASVKLDGTVVPSSSFTPIGTSGFSGAQLPVALGSHTVKGSAALGVFVYGFDQDDSYGYPGGQSLSPVALISSLGLTPPTANRNLNDNHCVTARVADQNGAGLKDIRVDFAVTGQHPNSGFAFTNATGDAQHCFVGTSAGSDTITAKTAGLTKTATVTFSALSEDSCPTGLNPTTRGTMGGSGDDVIVGTPGDDWIYGGAGNDIICGKGGNDRIDAGSGNDKVHGGLGNDTISGSSGDDKLYGDAGNDRVDGGSGNDAVHVSDNVKGNDTAIGGSGDDTCSIDLNDSGSECEASPTP